MKNKYIVPDAEVISLSLVDTLAASTYTPIPENPTRNGNDKEDIEFG